MSLNTNARNPFLAAAAMHILNTSQSKHDKSMEKRDTPTTYTAKDMEDVRKVLFTDGVVKYFYYNYRFLQVLNISSIKVTADDPKWLNPGYKRAKIKSYTLEMCIDFNGRTDTMTYTTGPREQNQSLDNYTSEAFANLLWSAVHVGLFNFDPDTRTLSNRVVEKPIEAAAPEEQPFMEQQEIDDLIDAGRANESGFFTSGVDVDKWTGYLKTLIELDDKRQLTTDDFSEVEGILDGVIEEMTQPTKPLSPEEIDRAAIMNKLYDTGVLDICDLVNDNFFASHNITKIVFANQDQCLPNNGATQSAIGVVFEIERLTIDDKKHFFLCPLARGWTFQDRKEYFFNLLMNQISKRFSTKV